MALIMGSIAVILCLVCFCCISGGGGGLLKFNENDYDLDFSPNKLISLCSSIISMFFFIIVSLGIIFFASKNFM